MWRLRDGIGAVAPGEVGNSDLLQAMHGALGALRVPASSGFGPGAVSAATLQSSLLSDIAVDRLASEQSATFATTRFAEAEKQLFEEGVDSDAEMQRLMLIEQAYAANARMLQTVDEMIDALMRI